MNKVRISKKNPSRALKAIHPSDSPTNDDKSLPKSFKNSIRFEKLSLVNPQKKQSKENTIRSHRYKHSSPSFQHERIRSSFSPSQQLVRQSLTMKKQEQILEGARIMRGLQSIIKRPKDKSPYLDRQKPNKSQRKITNTNRSQINDQKQTLRQIKTIKTGSLQRRSNSLQIHKSSGFQDILYEATKLMNSGEPRKSLFILKPLLSKDPLNYQALYIAAMNYYNIGDIQKCVQFLDNLLALKPDFSLNACLLRNKIYLKQGKKLTYCLAKLSEHEQLFAQSVQYWLEKGKIEKSIEKYEQALSSFGAGEKIEPGSLMVQQQIIQVYEKLDKFDCILHQIETFTSKHIQTKPEFEMPKCKSLFKLGKYDQVIQTYSKSTNPAVLFIVAKCFSQNQDTTSACFILQSSFSYEGNCTNSVKLMLLILCKNQDYYEASHLLARCQHMNVDMGALKLQIDFIQGTLSLIRRNIMEGVQKLTQLSDSLRGNEEQFSLFVQGIINAFLGYGNLCMGNFEKCEINYRLQIQNHSHVLIERMDYNIALNKAFLSYQLGFLEDALDLFIQVCKINEQSIEASLCCAITYINLHCKKQKSQNKSSKENLLKAKEILNRIAKSKVKGHNNVMAYVLYHKSVLHGYMQEWKPAIESIDEAIQKSEENYWRFFYQRASLLACIHNFPEAINDCTTAINLKNSQPSPLLLRAHCYQIQGEGSQAFKDLRAYISLAPEDKSVHMLAGKFLFENGSFQDAVAAFQHEKMAEVIENEDSFITLSKTLFLLGRFTEAGQQMCKVYQINPNKTETFFDGKMMILLHKLLSPSVNYELASQALDELYQIYGQSFPKNQIFKKSQYHTLKSICYFHQKNFPKARDQFNLAIRDRKNSVMKESLIEGSTREDQKDTKIFEYQMYFNISLCFLQEGKMDEAKKYASKIVFAKDDTFYNFHQELLSIFDESFNTVENGSSNLKIQIFPTRNKISHFLEEVETKVNGRSIFMKLCIPFPKVQPPEIFPKFDNHLLQQLSVERIERKPQAPWISREENAIVFTSRVEKYSRLEMQASVTQLSSTEKQVEDVLIWKQELVKRKSNKTPIMLKRFSIENVRRNQEV